MKHYITQKLLLVSTFLISTFSYSQLTVATGATAQQLGNNLAGNNVNIFNATITGTTQQRGTFQFVGSELGLNSGVILSTGNILDAPGPNSNGGTSSGMGGAGDPLLDALSGVTTYDAVRFQFDFEVQGDEIEFKFVFLSEEYNEFVNSGFNDVFAFYISGPGIVGQENLAVVPGTTTPVTINSINNGSFWQFYHDNENGNTNIEFDGFTTLMTAFKSGLQPCGIYTLSLRIADGSDSAFDSAVLLQENSLVQSNISASSSTFSANNTALEGCIDASFTFQLDSVSATPINIPIGVGGTATNGVDFSYIDSLIVIPAGQLSATLIINAIADGLPEGTEVVELYYTPSPCAPQDTVLLYIDDYSPLEYEINPTNVSCTGLENGLVDLTVTGGITPYTLTLTDSLTGATSTHTNFPVTGLSPGTYYVEVIDGYGCTAADVIAGNIFDAGQTFIPDGMGGSYSSTINLGGFGGSQTIQSADQIQSVCATMEHSRIGELEITLTAPNGQIVTLKEQPGGSVTNMGEPCAVGPTDGGNSNTDPGVGYNYCWQPISTYLTMVDESNSYNYSYVNQCDLSVQNDKYLPSGSYQPYESFDNFIGAPLNGGWVITVTDHIPNNNGYIFDWSITLQADPPDSVFTIIEPVGPTLSSTTVSPPCGSSTGSINLTVTGGSGPFTYLWNNGATTEDLSNIPAGAYSVQVTDANLCVHTHQVSLSNSGSLVLTAVVTNESCANLNNGAINLTVNGATNPISYSWNSGQTIEDISNLNPGTYTVNVLDGASCIGVSTYTIAEAAEINISEIITNENCGDQEGIIDITVFGGIAPYSYSWSNGALTEDADELAQGTYTVQVTDANNCTSSSSFSIINLVGNCIPDCDLEISSNTITNETCGNTNGAINLNVFTTNGPCQYTWSNGSTTEDLSGLAAGIYTVTITDQETCQIQQTFTLTNQTGTLAITGINTVNENCGNNQGGADATISGGVLPYSYLWSNGATTQDLSGVAGGTYTLTVTDATSCSVNQTVSIANITGTLTQTYGNATNETCGNGTGSIDIQIAGGQNPISYLWSNGATTQDLIGLSAGTYSCVITDGNGCSLSTPVYTVNNLSGGLAFTNIDVDNEVCSNGLGNIELLLSGGSLPYTFQWNTGATSQDIFNLSAGTYSATVTDNSGCSITTGNLTILNESGTLNLTSVNSFNELCGNGTGSINISVSGGTFPISFAWNTGSTSQDLSNLSSGNYTCLITDANNCMVQANASINNDPGIIAVDNIIVTNENCGQGNGALNLVVSGATAPITYAWSDGSTSQDLSNISAGTYTVLVTDNNGCSTSGNAVVGNIANGMSITNAVVSSEICGALNGSIDITINGGTAPLIYIWTNGATTEDLSGLSAGSFACTITDNSGCSIEAGPYTIVNSSGTLNAVLTTSSDETCSNVSGSVDVTVSGGLSPYSYNWSNGATTEDISGLSSGTYTLIVIDQNGCEDQVVATISNSPGTLALSSTAITDEICSGSNGEINISISGGTPGYTYLWSNGATTQDLTGLSAGTYSVTISDAGSCSVNSGALIVNNSSGNFSLIDLNTTDEICGDGTGNIDLIIGGSVGPVFYNWSNGATTQDITNLSAGSYSGTATNAGCILTFSATIFNEPGSLVATTAITNATCFDANGAVNLTVNGGNSPYTYVWSTGATTEDINSLNAGNYICNISDNSGCYLNVTASVAENGGPNISGVSITDETCSNSNGSISVSVTGGTAPYTYSWTAPVTNPCCSYTLDMQDLGNSWNGASITVMVNGISAGNYTVTSGGANTGTFAVCSGDNVQLTWNPGGFDNEVSFDLLNGSGAIIFSQGASPTPGVIYNASANCASGPLNGSTITNLTEGTYSVIVTDANGCEDSTTMVVGNSSGTLQISNDIITNETCSSQNGAIDLTITGNPPVSVLWNTGATTPDLSNLAAGTYTVQISDVDGCSINQSYILTNYTNGLAISSSTITDETCGNGNGAISIVTTGGAGPLSFYWSNGFTAQNISGLNAGSYTVVISDGSACDLTETFNVANNTSGLIVTSTITDENCGNANGSITQIVNGGTGPYSYSWSNGSTTSGLTNLSAGNYICTITDANGCIIIQSYTIINGNNGVTLTANITDENCGDQDGAINLTVAGGSTPFTYSWNNGSSTQDQINLGYGVYIVLVTDNQGCQATGTYSVASTGTFNLTGIAIIDETCNASNGSINLTFTGPNQPDQYIWSNGDFNQDINGLSTGWYTCEMSSFGPGGGCTVVDSFFVDQTSGTLNIDSIQVQNETCSQSNGSLNIYISGGTLPLTYSWSNGPITEDISGLNEGTYTLTVQDASGCVVTSSSTISNYTFGLGLTSAIITDENCGDGTGAIDITVNGGSPGYTFSWNTGATSEDITSLNAGTYSVTVTDALGCSVSTDLDVVNITNGFAILSSVSNETCNNANGAIDLTITGGVSPITYNWLSGETTEDLSDLTAGNYTCTVTDGTGCVIVVNETVNSLSASFSLGTAIITDENCGDATGSIVVNPTGGTDPLTYSWGLPDPCCWYTVNLYDLNNNGWGGTPTPEVIVYINGTIYGSYTIPTGTGNNFNQAVIPVCTGDVFEVEYSPTAQNQNNTYEVVDSEGNIIFADGPNPFSGGIAFTNTANCAGGATNTLANLNAGTYTLTVTDAVGCILTDTYVVNNNTGTLAFGTPIITDENCGLSNGAIDATVTGGSTPYFYSWSNGDFNEDLTGLSANDYTLSVFDAFGCSMTATYTVNILGSSVDYSGATIINASCATCADGSIDVSLGGAGAPYSYNWLSGETTEDLSLLIPGFYTVTITNSDGCDTTITFEIMDAASLSENGDIELNLVPNPSNGNFEIWYVANASGKLNIKMIDAMGRKVYLSEIKVNNSKNIIPIDVQFLAPGTYTLILQDGDFVTNHRIVIQ